MQKLLDFQNMFLWKAYDTLKVQHDMTIIALQIALGVFNQLLPPYAATHIFELYEEDNGQLDYCAPSSAIKEMTDVCMLD
ncbi:hypothetical protein L345_16733 [Ophiophagus hannah]|uniref:Uncharacterized protein n=1 Tax=Ophiophagus hannah TaxID=8665 RepID=V8N5J4_OPHHA|nr:hypothetical protein L345_16733 [Ophiophagus hannah]